MNVLNSKQCVDGWGGDDALLNERWGMGPVTRRDKMIKNIAAGDMTTQKKVFNYISNREKSAPVANPMTIFSAVMTPANEELLLKVLDPQALDFQMLASHPEPHFGSI